ncbi:hypothetical protein SET4581_02508, partial [Salmonella enterica subsp. enterica serovar Typhimurium str. ST4581]
ELAEELRLAAEKEETKLSSEAKTESTPSRRNLAG